MDYLALLQEKGLGPPILAIYAFAATLYVNPSIWLYAEQKVLFATGVATGAVLFLFLISTVLNDRLMQLLAEEQLASAYIQLKMEQGPEKEFYTDYDDETQAALDEMDTRTHEAVLAILTGALITISAPAIGLFEHGLRGLALSVPIALLSLLTISYPFYTRLHRAIDFAVRDATSNHED